MSESPHDWLVQFYLDKAAQKMHHGRWEPYFIMRGGDDLGFYFQLLMKSDSQLALILDKARQEAEIIKNSPLTKALDETEP